MLPPTCITTPLRSKNIPSGLSLMSQTFGRGTKCQQLWCLVPSSPGGTLFQMQTLLVCQMPIKAKPWSVYSLCMYLLMPSREADTQGRSSFHIGVFCWDSLFTVVTLRCLFPHLRRKKESIWISRSLTTHRP